MQGPSLAVKGSDFLLGELILLFPGLNLLILWNDPKSLQGFSLNTHGSSLKKNCFSCGEQSSALCEQFVVPQGAQSVTEISIRGQEWPRSPCREGPAVSAAQGCTSSPRPECCDSHSKAPKAEHLGSFWELVRIKEIRLHKSGILNWTERKLALQNGEGNVNPQRFPQGTSSELTLSL